MLGLFDSGSGGLNTVRCLKKMAPNVDLVYKIDRENAPYGTKKKDQLIKIIEKNIEELATRGASRSLIACCTASALYEELSEWHRSVSVPIIHPVADAARSVSKNGRIGVVATLGTVRTHAFARALSDKTALEVEAQELVALIDSGLCDATADKTDINMLRRIVLPLARKNTDTLILGCTHFPALYDSFVRVCHPLGIKHVINSAFIGARTLLEYREDDERKEKWQTTEEEEYTTQWLRSSQSRSAT